jgi:hypothetical protein
MQVAEKMVGWQNKLGEYPMTLRTVFLTLRENGARAFGC